MGSEQDFNEFELLHDRINSLLKENMQLKLENAKLRFQLKGCKDSHDILTKAVGKFSLW